MNRSKEDISVHFYNNSLRFHPKVCLVKDLLNIGIQIGTAGLIGIQLANPIVIGRVASERRLQMADYFSNIHKLVLKQASEVYFFKWSSVEFMLKVKLGSIVFLMLGGFIVRLGEVGVPQAFKSTVQVNGSICLIITFCKEVADHSVVIHIFVKRVVTKAERDLFIESVRNYVFGFFQILVSF